MVGGAVAMARYSMYGLLVISQTLNWFTRVGMPQLIPFIVTDMALSEAQRALLMGAFFPPCAVTPRPRPRPSAWKGASLGPLGLLRPRVAGKQPLHSRYRITPPSCVHAAARVAE